MYDYFLQPDLDSGPLYRAGRDPALNHSGDYTRLLRQHRLHCQRLVNDYHHIQPIGPWLYRRIADARTMRCACDHLMQHGGEAPGPNDLRLHSLSDGELWSLCRTAAEALHEGIYCPGPERIKEIPKGPGKPPRVLHIQNIQDRMVGKALDLMLQPLVDPFFYQFSMGFRPGRGPHEALAAALALAKVEHRTVWVTDDVHTAFDALPFARFVQVCNRHFPPNVLDLIMLVASTGKKRGIRQGSPASPLFWNIFADRFIDQPFLRKAVPGRLLRYADDLLVLCQTIEEADIAYSTLTKIARVGGTPLKAEGNNIVDLATGQPVNWLGYQLQRQGDDLAVRIAPRAWERLEEHLAAAHSEPAAPLRAIEIVRGWLGYQGPAYQHEDRRAALDRIRDVARGQAFDEIPARLDLQNYWQAAHARWHRVRESEAQKIPDRLRRLAEVLA